MGKKQRKLEQAVKDGTATPEQLAEYWASQTSKPAVSGFAKKKARQRLEAREIELEFTKAAAPQAGGVRSPGGIPMVTAAYKGAGFDDIRIMGQTFPAMTGAGLLYKPCFFIAEPKDGHWLLTRHVGIIQPDRSVTGMSDSRVIGEHTLVVQDALKQALTEWTGQQDPLDINRIPYKFFIDYQRVGVDARESAPDAGRTGSHRHFRR